MNTSTCLEINNATRERGWVWLMLVCSVLLPTVSCAATSNKIESSTAKEAAPKPKEAEDTKGLSQGVGHTDVEFLAGKWQGMVSTNKKSTAQGGNPTKGEQGTVLIINLSQAPNSVKGSVIVGQDREDWTFNNREYVWTNYTITVRAKRLKEFREIPKWIRKEMELEKDDQYAAFAFDSCKVNKTGQPCEAPKDIPLGVTKDGTWIFRVRGNQLEPNVYYTYANGNRRHLEQIVFRK